MARHSIVQNSTAMITWLPYWADMPDIAPREYSRPGHGFVEWNQGDQKMKLSTGLLQVSDEVYERVRKCSGDRNGVRFHTAMTAVAFLEGKHDDTA